MNDNQSNSRLDDLARTFTAEYLEESLQNKTAMSSVLKFHQQTTWQNVGDFEVEARLNEWIGLVQCNDILPEYYQEKYKFDVKKDTKTEGNTKRIFDKATPLAYQTIGEILHTAFGFADGYQTKPFPSAGALYQSYPFW